MQLRRLSEVLLAVVFFAAALIVEAGKVSHRDAARGMLLRSAAHHRQHHNNWPAMDTPATQQLNADDEGAQYNDCSCDCCYVRSTTQGLTAADIAKDTVVLSCMPKPGVNPDEPSGAGECAPQCHVEADEALQTFDSKSTVIDYARYCNLDCRPAEDIPETQCVSALDDGPSSSTTPVQEADGSGDSVPSTAAATPVVKMPVEHAMTQVQSSLGAASSQPAGGGPSLPLAKGDMLEAMVHAKAAGEAARLAKESYEKVLRAARVAAEASGKAVIAEIKREAGEQAKAALIVRKNYEAAAQKNAINAAIGIAKVYKNALLRDQGIAGTWSMRSAEYATAAAQRKGMALQMAKDAQGYLGTQEYKEAQNYLLQSQQAMEQARSFAGRSDAAHGQAVSINNQLKWYVWAEQAAAANALAANMPPDVAPPGMPPLP